MKQDKLYDSQQCIADSDQQHEGVVRWGDGKRPSPFSYSEKPRKGGDARE